MHSIRKLILVDTYYFDRIERTYYFDRIERSVDKVIKECNIDTDEKLWKWIKEGMDICAAREKNKTRMSLPMEE